MLRFHAFLLALASLLASSDARAQPESNVLEYRAEDAKAAVVSERNLLASERFWPYQVALVEPWQPPGRPEPLAPAIAGVLIRVEESGAARIDFGRDGLFEVPVGATDLIERANRVRLGEADKMAPNFVLDVAPRLAEPAGAAPRPFGLREALTRRAFLCVFADPSAPGFSELAAALAPLADRAGVLTILFAQGDHPDARLAERLRSLGWPTPFVLDHLAEAYTRSLLPEAMPPPALLLVSPEGRLLFQRPWRPDVRPALEAAFAKLEVR